MVEATREHLAVARAAGSTIPSQHAITLLEGYAIGAELEKERIAVGWRRVGWKLGFTNQALWAALGLDQPFRAPVYEETLASDSIEMKALVQPRIEPEIVVGVDRDIAAESDSAEIAAAIGWAAAGLEVVQCHFQGWQMSPAEAVADAGLHAALIIGERQTMTAKTVRALSECDCLLLCDGEKVGSGRGTDVLGGPLDALRWLLRGLPSGLRAGEIVTTGTLTSALPISGQQRWTNRLSGPVALGSVEVSFS